MQLTRHPPWLVKRFYNTEGFYRMKETLKQYGLRTVCEEALCPNMSECFSQGRVTFLILGTRCSRRCNFCFINAGEGDLSQEEELKSIVAIVQQLRIRHLVITSVSRDDLADKGACHFARVVKEVKAIRPEATIETLIPDFGGEEKLIGLVCRSGVDILNHNIETVPRLYPQVRPQADYAISLKVLRIAGNFGGLTKSGIMLGMGEGEGEVIEVFKDLRKAGVDILTVGQYLRPARDNLEIKDFIPPERFAFYREVAYNIGLKYVLAGPFVRSSYGVEEIIRNLKGGQMKTRLMER